MSQRDYLRFWTTREPSTPLRTIESQSSYIMHTKRDIYHPLIWVLTVWNSRLLISINIASPVNSLPEWCCWAFSPSLKTYASTNWRGYLQVGKMSSFVVIRWCTDTLALKLNDNIIEIKKKNRAISSLKKVAKQGICKIPTKFLSPQKIDLRYLPDL